MSMMPRLHSLNGLAVEVGRDKRTIAKALAGRTPDGKVGENAAWFIRTAVDALQEHDRIRHARGRQGQVPSSETLLRKIEATAEALQALLDQLSCEADIERRRAIATRDGHLVGDLDALMKQANSVAAVESRRLLEFVRESIIGGAMAAMLATCKWEIAFDGQPDAGPDSI